MDLIALAIFAIGMGFMANIHGDGLAALFAVLASIIFLFKI